MSWFKLYDEIINDPKIRSLSFEDRWHYVALMCCKNKGVQDEVEEIWEELLRIEIGLAPEDFQSLKKRLLRIHLIDEDWNPLGWEKRQEAKDPKAAERQKKYRERKNKRNVTRDVTHNVTHNVTVTSRVEEEREVEEEEEGKDGVHRLPQAEDAPAPAKRVNYQEIVDLYHEILPNHPKVKVLTDARKRHIKKLALKNLPDLEHWRKFFNAITRSDFLSGRVDPRDGRRPFIADLDFLIKPDKYVKILEGRYHE